jgi:hypothetical protein
MVLMSLPVLKRRRTRRFLMMRLVFERRLEESRTLSVDQRGEKRRRTLIDRAKGEGPTSVETVLILNEGLDFLRLMVCGYWRMYLLIAGWLYFRTTGWSSDKAISPVA